jgi:hypothetical protein
MKQIVKIKTPLIDSDFNLVWIVVLTRFFRTFKYEFI